MRGNTCDEPSHGGADPCLCIHCCPETQSHTLPLLLPAQPLGRSRWGLLANLVPLTHCGTWGAKQLCDVPALLPAGGRGMGTTSTTRALPEVSAQPPRMSPTSCIHHTPTGQSFL